MTGLLEGRVAIITGAGSAGAGWGNGRAETVLFAEQGAQVLAIDLSLGALEETVALAAEAGPNIHPYVCDVMDALAVDDMVASCQEMLGTPTVLVNNVGGSRAGGPVQITAAEWTQQLNYNLTTAYLTCRSVLPAMVEAGRGVILNTSSTSGIRWTGSAQAGYAAAKAGVIGLTRSIAIQYAPHGIRANTLVPGQLHTPLVEARLADQRAGGDVERLLAERQARIPLGFMGDGRDTAQAALFLASDAARFITGTELVIDGGMSARCD